MDEAPVGPKVRMALIDSAQYIVQGRRNPHGAVSRGGVTDPVQRRVQTLVSPLNS